MQQAEALNLMKMGKNIFLTGAPGNGKTYGLNQYIRYPYLLRFYTENNYCFFIQLEKYCFYLGALGASHFSAQRTFLIRRGMVKVEYSKSCAVVIIRLKELGIKGEHKPKVKRAFNF